MCIKLCTHDESEIIVRLSEGDEAAFSKIYERYWINVFRVAYKYLNSKDVSEDIVQEVFTTLWRKRKDFDHIQNLEAYLVTMAQNLTYKELEKWAYETRKNKEYAQELPLSSDDSEPQLLTKQYEELLNQAIDLLPPRQKEVFKLVKNQGFSHIQTAEKLNLSQAAVKKNMVRALLFIRKYISPYLVRTAFLIASCMGLC